MSCNPKLWNVRESRLNGKSCEAVATNAKLEQLLLSVQRAYQTLCKRGIEFSANDIKEQIQGSMQNRTTFLQRYDQMVEDEKQLVVVEITARCHSVITCSESRWYDGNPLPYYDRRLKSRDVHRRKHIARRLKRKATRNQRPAAEPTLVFVS